MTVEPLGSATLPRRDPALSPPPFGVMDLFKIGIGPSSSHTVGPMRAAATFRRGLSQVPAAVRLRVTMHGSLAWTGKGHATDRAVILGLMGEWPDTIDPDQAESLVAGIALTKALPLGDRVLAFDPAVDLVFDYGPPLGRHPNAMTFAAFDATGALVAEEIWYSRRRRLHRARRSRTRQRRGGPGPPASLRHRRPAARRRARDRPAALAHRA